MTTFLFSYRMPVDYAPGRPGAVEEWRDYFDGLGWRLTDPGNPVFAAGTIVGQGGTDTHRLGGYSLVSAEDMAEAVALAEKCPAVAAGGGVEVGLLAEVFRDGRLIQAG